MTRSISVAQFGLGGLGALEATYLAETDGVDVVAGADVASEARESFDDDHDAATYESYEALLRAHADALDAVNVVTPHAFHFEQAMACLEAGLSVHLEKPMVIDVGDAVELAAAAEAADGVFQLGYQRHFDPRFRALREAVDEELGTVHGATCYLDQHWVDQHRDSWRTDPELAGGGQLYDSGSHLLDALLWTTRSTPSQVAAVVDERDAAVDVDSALALTLDRDGSPVTASVFVTGEGPTHPDTRDGLVVWGTEASAEYTETGIEIRRRDGDSESRSVEGTTDPLELTRLKLERFVDAVRGEAEPAVPASVGVQVTALTEAAYRAAETGQTVDVPELLAEARSSGR